MVRWKKIIGWTVLAVVGLLAAAVAGGFVFLQSDTFHRYALHKIEENADQATGAHSQIGALELTLLPLTVRLQNIVVHGAESANEPPLLRVDELTVGIEFRALLHEQFHLRELLIQHPVVFLRVNSHGGSNLPQAPPSQGHTGVFELAIRHFALWQGRIYYNDNETPINADLYDLRADAGFNPLTTVYKGAVRYNNGHLTYGNYAAMPHSARVEFSASPAKFSLQSAVIKVASSVLSVNAEVTDFANPTIAGNYDIQLHAQDFGSMTPGMTLAGNIHTRGTIHYQDRDNQSFLRSLSVKGEIDSTQVFTASPQAKITVRSLRANYELANASLKASEIEADALGGRVNAEAEVLTLDATPLSHVRAAVHHISLREAQQSIRPARTTPVTITGTLDGTSEARWKGGLDNIQARADLTIRGGARDAKDGSATIPVNAAIHTVYDAPHQRLMLRQSNIHTSALTLAADGEISKRSSLRVHAQADDLHQLILLAASFGLQSTSAPAVSGSATLDANVEGSMQRPQVSGQLSAANLHVQGSDWKGAGLSFAANPSQFAISNGSLVSADQGRASFDGKVALHNWSYSSASLIHAELVVQRMPVGELQQLANVQYPISGDLSAQLSISGSQINPSGSGLVEITRAHAYGEPIQELVLKSRAENGSITANINLAIGAGTVVTTMIYTPKTRAYNLKLDAPSIALEKIRRLQANQIKGTLSASVSGQGTFDDPQLNALIQIPHLQLQQNSIGMIKAELGLANRRANLVVDSQVSQAALRARAQIDLAGDYQTDASIDTNSISLGPLLASFSSSVPQGFQGQTELHATLKGPLKDKSQLEAHITIPTFSASYQQLQIAAAAPIHADYMHSTLALQPAEIRGTDTSLRVQGSIPFAGSAAPTLSAQGSIDMQIARIFDPGLHSSGKIALDIHAAGSPKAPTIQGQVRIENVAVSTTSVPLGVDKLNGTLNIDNQRIQISGMTAQVGSGEVSLGGGITYHPQLQFTLAMRGKSIRLRYPEGLRTLLDGNLAFNGDMKASSLTGRVLVDSLSFTPDFDLSTFADQFSSNVAPSQPGFADAVKVNVSLQSKQNLSATSSQVSVEGALNLNVTGTAANPVITGRTELTSGELFYRGNRYQLERGIITFADPNQTNPDLNVSVTSTIEQYNVTINLRGTLDRLATTYSSDPPLATADVIHLIAFGNTTAEASAQSASQSTDAMVASSVIGSGLTSGVQKLAGFSSLQIDPLLGGSNQNPSARVNLQQRVTKNFLFTFSTDVSQPGQEIVQGDYQINKRWSVAVTRDQLGGVTVGGRLHTKF